MNILLINHYAGSPQHGMEYRPYYLAREWARLGHNVRIIASSVSHVRSHSPILNSKDTLNETIDEVHYTWFKTPSYKNNGISRVKNIAAFVIKLFSESKSIANTFNPDVVIASSTYPMDIWPARRIAKLANAKLVFEVHDLWPLSPIELGGIPKWHPFIVLVQRAEDYAYCHADVVVSILPKVHKHMKSRGLDLNKLHIIPNGIDPDEWKAPTLELENSIKTNLLQYKNQQQTTLIGYTGAHGVANALDTLLDVAKILENENVTFALFGGGPEKKLLQGKMKNEKINNVIFFDPIKKAQIPSLLQHIDIAYIGLKSQPLFRFGIAPNKLMDYMVAGKPVVMAINAGNDPVAEAGCGLTVPSENPNAIAQGIRKILRLSRAEREKMGQHGRNYIFENHVYPVLAKKFLKAIYAHDT